MIPRPARYLLRFDDLCPTVSRERWQPCRALIDEFSIRPILAVVPDNQDPDLQVSLPDPEFWNQMRLLESRGATIGLHGYRHRCMSHGRSLVPTGGATEFAGIPAELQQTWIAEGLGIQRKHGLDPKIWVAPGHGFDHNTLLALRSERIECLSDGFTRGSALRSGIVWIPQQLWAPVEKRAGLWTICVHPNTISDAQIAELHEFLHGHANQFTSVDCVLAERQAAALSLAERMQEEFALWRRRASLAKRHLRIGWRKDVENQAR